MIRQQTGLDFYISEMKREGYHVSERVYLQCKEVLKHQIIRAYCREDSSNGDINPYLLEDAQEYYRKTYGE
jgi:hypothetical protein